MTDKLSKKERMQIPRQVMPAQTPEDRVRNFKEVPFGLSEEQALTEAARCLECKKESTGQLSGRSCKHIDFS